MPCLRRTGVVYNPLAQTCLFDSGWRADRCADDRRRLQSEEDSVAVCAASTAEAVAKSEAATKQELQTQVEQLKGRMESADAAHAAQTQELKESMDEMRAAHAAETRELKAMLRQLLVKR